MRCACRLLFCASVALVRFALAQSLHPTHLRCEYLENPLGLGELRPRLSWWCESARQGERQSAYQIIVSSSRALCDRGNGDLWDSGEVVSDDSTQIAYGGKPLASREGCWWKVRVWDREGGPGTYSVPAYWEMGLLNPNDWKGQWIGEPFDESQLRSLKDARWIWYPEGEPQVSAPKEDCYFRAYFDVPDRAAVKEAEYWFAVDDSLIAYLNGREVGRGSDFHDILALPVTGMLRQGRNVVAVTAHNEVAAAGLALVVCLRMNDGTQKIVASTGDDWKVSRVSPTDWQSPAFDDSAWSAAKVLGPITMAPWREPAHPIPPAPAPYLRKDFNVQKPVARARVFVSALGLYNLFVNGHKLGHDVFDPGWTDYRKRVQYQAFDVTSAIREGKNAIGMVLGDGWYCGHVGWGGRNQYGRQPLGLAQLEIDYADGTRDTVATGVDWKYSSGPIRASDFFMGENYDARDELGSWSEPGYDDARWGDCVAHPLGGQAIVSTCDQPVVVWNHLAAKSVTEPAPNHFVFDLGQNMVGWARLKVSGARGAKVTLRFAEMLNPDGTVYTTNLRGAKATDTYILKGGGREVYEPSFTFHGFRYVELTGFPGKPGLDAVTGIVAGSGTPNTGTFECSNPMVNQLWHNIYWGQRGNYLSIPTDCPQRDERLGWMGDAETFIRTATFNCNVAAFMTKWLQDVRDGQSSEGGFADVSPRLFVGDGAPAWGDAGVIVPWYVYLAYNDKRALEREYDAMKAWVEYIHSANPSLLWENRRNNDYGDWLSIKADTPKDVLATAFFAHSTDLLARSAAILGKAEDANHYRSLFEQIKAAFHKAYVGDDVRIKGDTQTCYALALGFDLLPEGERAQAADHLVDDILNKHDGNLSTGFVGVKLLAPVLTQTGHLDVAYKLLLNDTFPSWLYSIKQGATTIWERWDGYTKEHGFQDPGMNSFNHYALGSIGEWLYSVVGGIDYDSSAPGFKKIIIHPRPGGGLTWAKTSLRTMYGEVKCSWNTVNGFKMDLTVPANTTAEVYVPCPQDEEARASQHPGFQRLKDGFAVYEVGGGSYTFGVT